MSQYSHVSFSPQLSIEQHWGTRSLSAIVAPALPVLMASSESQQPLWRWSSGCLKAGGTCEYNLAVHGLVSVCSMVHAHCVLTVLQTWQKHGLGASWILALREEIISLPTFCSQRLCFFTSSFSLETTNNLITHFSLSEIIF